MGDKALHARNREIATKFFDTRTTYAKLGREYGVSGDRVRQIVIGQKWRREFWWLHHAFSLRKHNPPSELMLPEPEAVDMGEGLDWTPEAQYKEFELVRKYR